MAKDLLYRPELGYKKDYYTEGTLYDETKDQLDSDDEGHSLGKEELIDQLLNEIDSQIKFLPDQILNVYFPPYLGMKYEYENLKNEYKDPDPGDTDEDGEDPDPTPPGFDIEDPDAPTDDLPDDLFDRVDDVYIDVEDPISDPAQIIKDSYYVNFLDIYEDYLYKIKVAVTNYIFTTIQTVSQGLKDTSEEVNYSTTELNNTNLSHLSDYIIKSDIIVDQTMRLHKKLFDVDETILHIKHIRLSKEQALRYNSIPEMEQKTYLDVDSNVLLKESIRVAEKKYEENFYALYKYLNSSVILLDESLKTIVRQDKAKVIINKNEERE